MKIFSIFIALTNIEGHECGCTKGKEEFKPRDCQAVKDLGFTTSGAYNVTPVGSFSSFKVYCNMEIDQDGWLVFQRRRDGTEGFYRGWDDYQFGFGDIFLKNTGNLRLHMLTRQGRYELRVDLQDWNGNIAFALYSTFSVAGPEDLYRLTAVGYSGDAGDALTYHSGSAFSTPDRDNDNNEASHCAERYKGPWWQNKCHFANLNGLYHGNKGSPKKDGVNWQQWRGYNYSLKATEMKLRRR